MKAKYIGENGSQGFITGKVYEIETKTQHDLLWVMVDSEDLVCPYSSLEFMLNNWILLEQSQAERAGKAIRNVFKELEE